MLWILAAGSMLASLARGDVVSEPPMLLSSALQSPHPSPSIPIAPDEQAEPLQPGADAPSIPGFLDSAQESGFFGEDAEEPKPPQAIRMWDSRENYNSTDLDSETLIGYHSSSVRPSTAPMEDQRELNSSVFSSSSVRPSSSPSPSSLPLLSDSRDSDLWESDGEYSGMPAFTPDTPPPVQTTVTADMGHAAQPDETFEEEVTGMAGKPDVSSHTPTMPETGTLPSRVPLQPDDTEEDEDEQDDEEEVVFASVDNEEEEQEEGGMENRQPSGSRGHHSPLTIAPYPPEPIVLFTQVPWNPLELTTGGSELRHGGMDLLSEEDLLNAQLSQESVQVVCVDWSNLGGKGYVVLNMSYNLDCDEFREESGERLLELLETAFSRKMNSPQGSWHVSLSKPSSHDHQLLMTLGNEQGVIATKDVLSMLGEIRRGLHEIGIVNYSSVSSCHSRPSPTRSDYGKLFVVLVIIGSVCIVIIASGLVYICWQRRLPKMKSMSRGEELHFVENGCHDNPTLDVASDSQSEMQEKKPSANGVSVEGGGWQVLVSKQGKEEAENMEEDTHL
ncbi:podocalyxin-like protein 2 [Denticeps clupeoides]|uniref:Podocalyxin-like protein 2 n=1 Tax=Denticeps clupeoides TaxID=299321 RepID=A0AAY4B3R0_9TELE|nr:podocalyxin-like protein 2 [Denticeps clupeoides]